MSTPRVIVNDRHMPAYSAIDPVIRKYSNQLGLTIDVANPHCDYFEPRTSNEVLYIRFFACPRGTDNRQKAEIRYAYGIRLNVDQRDSISPTKNFQHAIRDPMGVIVAEYWENTLYVLFNLPSDSENADILMEHILADFVELYVGTPEEIEARKKARFEKLIADSEKNLTESYTTKLLDTMRRFKSLDSDLKETEDEAKENFIEAQTARKNLRKLSRNAQHILKDKSKKASFMAKQFGEIKKLAANGNAYVINGEIHVNIGQIDIRYNTLVYDIGEFEIVIDMNNNWVKCINMTRVESGHYHPHVTQDGIPCWGNVENQVDRMLEGMQYVSLIRLAKAFLKTCDNHGWYHSVMNWPMKNIKE